jgi:membrane protease YdiL (CAAX protease family)
MKYAGKFSPLIHSLLFSLYHVFTPWMFVTRTIGMIPLAYAVKKKNLNISMIVHILINSIDVVMGMVFILGMGRIT